MDKNKIGIDVDNDKLSHIANMEAGTDGILSDELAAVANMEAGTDFNEDAVSDSPATKNAPYQNLAKYKMIPDMDESDNIQNNQGS